MASREPGKSRARDEGSTAGLLGRKDELDFTLEKLRLGRRRKRRGIRDCGLDRLAHGSATIAGPESHAYHLASRYLCHEDRTTQPLCHPRRFIPPLLDVRLDGSHVARLEALEPGAGSGFLLRQAGTQVGFAEVALALLLRFATLVGRGLRLCLLFGLALRFRLGARLALGGEARILFGALGGLFLLQSLLLLPDTLLFQPPGLGGGGSLLLAACLPPFFVAPLLARGLQYGIVDHDRVDRQEDDFRFGFRQRQAEEQEPCEHRMQGDRPADRCDGRAQRLAHRLRSSSSRARAAFGSVRNPILVAPAC